MPHKLLLADDSVTIQRVVELTFSSEDIQVLSVADGEEAIARIPIERPDIVLADIGMPRRTGYDVAAYVKERPDLAHIPVLLMAGAFEPVDEARARQVRSDGVLIKPFEPQQVIARVRELLSNRKRVDPSALPGHQGLPDPPSLDVDVADTDAMIPPPAPPPQAQRPGGDGSLDDYFDRLDAAFAGMGGHPPRPVEMPVRAPAVDPVDEAPIPSLEDLLAARSAPARPIDVPPTPPSAVRPQPASVAPPIEPPDSHPSRASAPAAHSVTELHGRNVVAEAFGALLAIEQGEPGASAIRLPIAQSEPVLTEAQVDEIARRVLERLGTNANQAMRDLVIRIVSEVSERLVEQEIRRIRTGSRQ